MKKLPEVKNRWQLFSKLISYGVLNKIFVSALRLKIFDYLDGKTSKQVAEKFESNPRNTELFLNALAGMGLVQKKEGMFTNTAESGEFLVSDSPTYIGEYLIHYNSFNEQFPETISDLVKQGPPSSGMDMRDASFWAKSAKLAAAYQYSGEAQQLASIINQLPEFNGMKRMLDLGGGSGFYTMATVALHPNMQGVILEQPAVAEVAKNFVKGYGMEDRVTVIAGDYAKDDFDGTYDLILASATLNFYKHSLDDIFIKVRDSLMPGGVFITHQDGIREERTKPFNHISEFLLAEMMGSDFAFTKGEIAETMLRCGFQSVRSFTKESNIGEMDVDIARKVGVKR